MRLAGPQVAAWRGRCPRRSPPPQLEALCATPSITAELQFGWLRASCLCWGTEILLCRADKIQNLIKDDLKPLGLFILEMWLHRVGAEGGGCAWELWLRCSCRGSCSWGLCHTYLFASGKEFKGLRELEGVGGNQ